MKKLRNEGRTDEHFEVILNSLTLEEIIAIKLELANKAAGNRLLGIPVWKSAKHIVKDAFMKAALSMSRTKQEAMSFLGLLPKEFNIYLKKYKIERYFEEEGE